MSWNRFRSWMSALFRELEAQWIRGAEIDSRIQEAKARHHAILFGVAQNRVTAHDQAGRQ